MGSGANLKRSDDTLPIRGTPAGGGYSTVGDFNRFAEALVSHRLLRAETLQKLISGGITGKMVRFTPMTLVARLLEAAASSVIAGVPPA